MFASLTKVRWTACEDGGVLDWWYDGGKDKHFIDLATDAGQRKYRDLAISADLIIETRAIGGYQIGLDHGDLVAPTSTRPGIDHLWAEPVRGRTGSAQI